MHNKPGNRIISKSQWQINWGNLWVVRTRVEAKVEFFLVGRTTILKIYPLAWAKYYKILINTNTLKNVYIQWNVNFKQSTEPGNRTL